MTNVREWLNHLTSTDDSTPYHHEPPCVLHARVSIIETFLRPISYFGADTQLMLTVRGRDARIAAMMDLDGAA